MPEKLVAGEAKSCENENKENGPDSGQKWMGWGAINSTEDGKLIGGGFKQWEGQTAAN
ncbi:UNVERIFIED_CONTAM: hypothetical protein Sangu_2566900 [Sesamum angustifolium]|uniref:Uncharacterized protein n=1 Tax=Sesamum angustifolium TaxID=2727405 RepID=A0AAW2J8G0_9LAMI